MPAPGCPILLTTAGKRLPDQIAAFSPNRPWNRVQWPRWGFSSENAL